MAEASDDDPLLSRLAHHPLAGVTLLLGATVAALIWANSPAAPLYHDLFDTELNLSIGPLQIHKPLVLWVNDGLMGIFFFVVGLEIKRELIAGELSTMRKALLPAFAAVGGMAVPAALYVAVFQATGAEGPGGSGWGIPMATDIAFALGALALLGDRVPPGLKVFLTALAIVDDIGAVLVIAIFYTDQIALVSLGIGLALFAVAIAANRFRVRSSVFYFVLGTLVWVAFLKSGVHATVAALLMAFTIPARTRLDGAAFAEEAEGLLSKLRQVGLPVDRRLNSPAQQKVLTALEESVIGAGAPLQRLERGLHPLVTLLVLPVFALANAGVALSGGLGDALVDPIALGIVAGLVVGKPLGVMTLSWLAVRLKVADLPPGVRWAHVLGAGALAGIGFTMALFIGSLAFTEPAALTATKLGILMASAISAALGLIILRRASA